MPLIDPAGLEVAALRQVADLAGQRVIEIGAGDARLGQPLSTGAALWVALDPDVEELRLAATEAWQSTRAGLRLLATDGRWLGLAAGSFDIALFSWSLC